MFLSFLVSFFLGSKLYKEAAAKQDYENKLMYFGSVDGVFAGLCPTQTPFFQRLPGPRTLNLCTSAALSAPKPN
jgi:hypothetical protein